MQTDNLSRRSFLAVVGGVGASLMLGCFADAKHLKGAEFAPNATIRIDPDGWIVITAPRPDMGQGTRTALPMLVAEEMDADWTKVRIDQAPGNEKLYGSQQTGGSTSVRVQNKRLREAGAAARVMLVAAAAQKWGVDASSCTTENGKVLHAATGRSLGYGELSAAAATQPVPTDIKLKAKSEYRLVGKPTKGVDVPKMVDGSAVFGQDVQVKGAVYAAVLHAPSIGGKVANVDDVDAKKVAGVLDVQQVPGGVAVIATDTWSALKGREALKVEWSQAGTTSSAALEEQLKSAIADHLEMPAGAKVVRATCDFPFLAHAPMEPMNAIADVKADSCTVWVPTQNPGGVHRDIAEMLNLPLEKVTINVPLTGGGFGGRHGSIYVEQAVTLSKALGKPVKLMWTRQEDMANDAYRPMSHHSFVGAVDGDGNPVGWSHQAAILNTRGGNFGNPEMPYSIPSAGLARRNVGTTVPTGAWRSVEHTQIDVSNEMFIDELAHAAGQDPLEFRLKLVKDERLKRALQTAAEKAGWGTPLPKGSGRGIACFIGYGSCSAFVIQATVAGDAVKVDRVVCAVDVGTAINPNGVRAQMEGGCVDGLSTALKAKITVADGKVEQSTFGDFMWLTIGEMPPIEIHILDSDAGFGGLGEVGYPPTPAALANAVFAATGKRVRRFPIVVSELV